MSEESKEKARMLEAYAKAGCRVGRAAEALGLSPMSWRRRVIALGLDDALAKVRRRAQREGWWSPPATQKLTDAAVLDVRRLYAAEEGPTMQELAEQYGVTKLTIYNCVHGKRKTAAEKARLA